MRDDEDQGVTQGGRGDDEGNTSGLRTGPRHAAPRKPLLTRVHVPAGKAIALAAMPTAVLMGMGLTPRLAQADELPKNPFKGDRCVTQSDSPSPQATPSASASATPSATPSPSPSGSAQTAAPGTSGTSGASGTSSSGASGTGTSGGAHTTAPGSANSAGGQQASTPAPAPAQTRNPLDPLGLGNALKGLFGGGSTAAPTPSATPTPTPTPSATPPAGGGSGSGGSASGGGSGSGGAPAGSLGKTVGDAAAKATGAAAGAADSTAKSVPSATPSATPSPTDGQGFPCPTYNAKALADAKVEQTPELLPNTPWTLKTDLLTLLGLDYHGVVQVKTENGTVKDVLKFTATSVDIKNLHQITDGPNGTHFHVQARQGSTSTIRNGTVTMYTEELKGNLFGLIPVTFTPKSPPPLNVPAAFFTNVTVLQAGQFGGTLTVPGMHLFHE